MRERHGTRVPDRPARSSSTWPSRPSSRPGSASARTTIASTTRSAHDLGTAVNVMTMVFGNMGDDSGTGVAFTRDPNTGDKVLFGEYLTNAQGEDVVAGIRTPLAHQRYARADARHLHRSSRRSLGASSAITATCRISSSPSSAAGCTCSRRARASAPRPLPCGSLRTWSTKASSPSTRRSRASSRHTSTSCCATSSTRTPSRHAKKIATGLNASPGAAVGKAVFNADRAFEMAQARARRSSSCALRLRPTTSTAWPPRRAS